MKKVTIYDVAREAQVAPSTVSRAFTSPTRVNAATRDRILAAAQELQYTPLHSSPRTDAGGHRTIAMILADITNPHFFEMIRGAELRSKAGKHTMVVVNAEESAQIEMSQLRELAPNMDGFIIASSRLPDPDLINFARQHKTILLNRDVEGLTSVRLDMNSACRQILEHLASLGHSEFTYCAGPPGSWMGATRWAHLSEGAKQYGMTAHRIGPYAPTVAAGAIAAEAAFRSHPTAIIAHNDLLAFGIMQRLKTRGVKIPEDVSLIGFDNNFAAELVGTPLTTVGGPGVEVGARAVDLLVRSINEQPNRRGALTDAPHDKIILPTQLILRESSGPVPAE